MEENNNQAVMEEAVEEKKPSKGAAVKEWFRKLTVKLKRKTHVIPLVLTLITSVVWLCMIGTFSQLIQTNSGIGAVGISMFVNTLASILILPIFLNAYPKRKKPNVVYIILIFVVFALLIGMDILFYTKVTGADAINKFDASKKKNVYDPTCTNLIVHMILVGICILAVALLPVYKKLINKINTRKDLQSNDFKGEIDTSAEV